MSEIQHQLFHEDVFDAMRSDAEQIGGPRGLKVVAGHLWPSKPVDQAARWFADCLNRDRPAKLDPEEFIHFLVLAVQHNAFCTLRFLGGATRCEFKRVTPEEIQASVADRMETAVQSVRALLREWESAR